MLKTLKIAGGPGLTAISSENSTIIWSMIMKSAKLTELVLKEIMFSEDDAEHLDDMTEHKDEDERKLPNLKVVEFTDCISKGRILARVLDEGSKSIKLLEVSGSDLSYLNKMQQTMRSLNIL